MNLKRFATTYKWQIAGTLIGFAGGYLYWYFIGCSSGTCPIQSHWHTSTLYGGILGFFISDLKKKPQPKNDDNDHGTV